MEVMGSIYVVPRWSAASMDAAQSTDKNIDPQQEHNKRNLAAGGTAALLLRAAQGNPQFAPAMALPPGIHMACHVDPQATHEMPINTADGVAGDDSTKTVSITDALRTFWKDVKIGPSHAEEAARLAWQRPCREVLMRAAVSLGFESITAMVDRTPDVGWALVPCTPDGNVACSLARGSPGRNGKVAWFHHPLEEASENAGKALVGNILLAT